jgi:hypothetical protein
VHSQSQFASLPVPTPRSEPPHSRLPSRGNWSPPVLADLEGNGKLDILMSAFDGFLYAFKPDGTPVPGWPVEVKLPPADLTGNPNNYIRDAKLMAAPSVGDVLKTGKPQVFVPSDECLSTPAGKRAWMYGIWPDGNLHAGGPYLPGWPAGLPSLAGCYDLSIDFVEEGAAPASIADFDGSGTLRVATAGVTGPPVVLNGDGSVFKNLTPACTSSACAPNPPYYPGDSLTVDFTGQGGIGDLFGNGTPSYVQSNAGLVSLNTFNSDKGTAHLPQTYEKAWNATTGSVLEAFPRTQDGFPFFDAPLVANLSESSQQAIVEANDSGWVHAYEPSGGEAPGFPKFTGQWPSFSGVIAGAGPGGQQQLAYGTREGSLFVWQVGGSPNHDSWPHYHHDADNSSLFGSETAP